MNLSVKSVSTQVITVKVENKNKSMSFEVSFVHGYHTFADRRLLWIKLAAHDSQTSGSWISVSDYNAIFSHEHTMNGNPFNDCEIKHGL